MTERSRPPDKESPFRDRHAQYENRWLRAWVGLRSELLFGVATDVVDGFSFTVGIGPLYFGIGGYGRG